RVAIRSPTSGTRTSLPCSTPTKRVCSQIGHDRLTRACSKLDDTIISHAPEWASTMWVPALRWGQQVEADVPHPGYHRVGDTGQVTMGSVASMIGLSSNRDSAFPRLDVADEDGRPPLTRKGLSQVTSSRRGSCQRERSSATLVNGGNSLGASCRVE